MLDDSRKDDEEDDDYGSEAESDGESQNATKAITPQKRPSQAYLEFLQFLQLGCCSPLQGYPTIVIIVSTIPSSVC
jgi:E3 ubiquitin-protein ligase listerin